MEKTNPFICPECGSTVADTISMVSTDFRLDDPLSSVLQWISCRDCKTETPAHLGQRWHNISVEQAKQEWQETYRELVMAEAED